MFWSGKFAIVTGVSSGVGKATTIDFLSRNINVIGLDINTENFSEIAESENSGKFYPKKCDIADLKSIKETFEWIENEFGVVSIFVNCAAVLKNFRILEEDEVSEKINSVININFTGLVHLVREAVRLIKKSNDFGLVVNICSIEGHMVPYIPHFPTNVYPATKHAVRAFSEQLRKELVIEGNKKIRVTNLSPGFTKTNLLTAGGFQVDLSNPEDAILSPQDVSLCIMLLLETPMNVNISQLTVKPVGEQL
jgi:NADP-dependent 3-hydroxy acid dehydrogenase YdfG